MADALLSPVVGGVFFAISAGLIRYSAKKITAENDIAKTPLMGVLGAFIFAAQMINFSIPGTGSSGHLGGGLLLAILLGPHRAFLTLASVLVVQCLFFADGGLLALGCNIFNLAFFPAFVAYPFIYKAIAKDGVQPLNRGAGSIIAALIGLEFGAFSVVIQTVLSGNSVLPFSTFSLFMLPIHGAIGIVEGLVTYAVISFVYRVQPALITGIPVTKIANPIFPIFAVAALVTGGLLSYTASDNPDGLEWAIEKTDHHQPASSIAPKPEPSLFTLIQEKLAILPDYSFRNPVATEKGVLAQITPIGTSVSGVSGSLAALLIALLIGFAVRKKNPVHN